MRSRPANAGGEKFSFLNTICLMILCLSRRKMAFESDDPAIEGFAAALTITQVSNAKGSGEILTFQTPFSLVSSAIWAFQRS